eukprot:Tamp_27380.p2 GENE.Tamp_27380~~Tamp_27380.p2  ORF type:complete len:166 (-),score=35.20 Tamp_27380:359-829(-)
MAPAMLALPDGVYFPTSAGIEMCIDAYMNQVAAELSGEAQIATVLPVSTPVHGPANKPSEQQPARAGPGHVYLCGQALLLGAMQATGKASQQLFSSEADLARVWEDEFVRCSQAAADSMTPVAGYYIREHVLRQPEETREDQAVHDGEAPWVSDYY